MDLKLLASIPTWEWPPNGSDALLAILRDRQQDESDRLLAAELAGEVVAINDDLADTLLWLVGDTTASEPLRCRAALSLGPVLEQMDWDDDFLSLDDEALGGKPISEHTFQRIQQTLRARYLEEDVPPEVRRHILESSVRAPAEWHPEAVRAAYSREDRDWRLTAVLAMGHVRGFGDQIVAALNDPDAKIRRAAVAAAGNWKVDEAWPLVASLLAAQDTDKALLLTAIEAAVTLSPQEAESLLLELTDSDDAEIAAAADDAAMMARAAVENEFDEDPDW